MGTWKRDRDLMRKTDAEKTGEDDGIKPNGESKQHRRNINYSDEEETKSQEMESASDIESEIYDTQENDDMSDRDSASGVTILSRIEGQTQV
ncbi:hypothetical protein QC760_010636 [Botrytis cinerea]